jgi:hypothetical protein
VAPSKDKKKGDKPVTAKQVAAPGKKGAAKPVAPVKKEAAKPVVAKEKTPATPPPKTPAKVAKKTPPKKVTKKKTTGGKKKPPVEDVREATISEIIKIGRLTDGSSLSLFDAVFVEDYLTNGHNATEAYLSATVAVGAKPIKRTTAGVNGHKKLKETKIAQVINRRLRGVYGDRLLEGAAVLKEIHHLAFANLRTYLCINSDGSASVDLRDLTDDQFLPLQEYSLKEKTDQEGNVTRTSTIKLADKGVNLERLGRHMRLFSENLARVNAKSAEILNKAQYGEISALEAAYEFSKLGEPLPRVLELELLKEAELADMGNAPTFDELEARAAQIIADAEEQAKLFLPERREKVSKLKEELRSGESFRPDDFTETSKGAD